MTKAYQIDPLLDPRWPQFLEDHPQAALFHSREWLGALQQTYGYRAIAITTSRPDERLTNGLVFCRVKSWLTGQRLVALPFSDHCVPLINNEEESACLFSSLFQEVDRGKDKYLEVRSIAGLPSEPSRLSESDTFCLHRVDLRPNLDDLFRSFHDSCIRRKIARAEQVGLVYEEGTSEELLRKFYRMVLITRRRHQIPPQPLSWFRNLLARFRDNAKIRLALYGGQPAAGVFTIRYKSTMTYKYGCSDVGFHKFGPMQFVMWKAIQDAKENGLVEFDMGRTEWSNPGLLAFKDRWGGARATLRYFRHPAAKTRFHDNIPTRIMKQVFARTPDTLLTTAGNILYRHIA